MIEDAVLARLEGMEAEFAACTDLLADPAVVADRDRYVATTRRYRALEEVVEALGRWRAARADASAAAELLGESGGGEADALREEVATARSAEAVAEEELRALLLPRDPFDDRDVIVEIRGAEGGEEANLFARDLCEMYRAWAVRRGWTVEVLDETVSDLGGRSEVSLRVAGDGVWSRLKFEAGPHRVQRVPVTESQGRVHTSSATVVVLPVADEVEVDLDPSDLQIDVFRSSGPGGQSVNTTDSAVRVTHLPTGTTVSMQDQKSQLQNRARALEVLRSRLLQQALAEQAADASGRKRAQIGGGGRSEKIRTYNVKENRVTDHRIGLTLHSLDRVLAGDLDPLSDALLAEERERRLREAT
ncbi:MAG: peptide chain release factor 1 [Microthrixaceae bacterium]